VDDDRPPRDDFATRLRGFGPAGTITTLIVLVVSAVLGPLKAAPVLLWAWFTHTPWRELGFIRPRSLWRSVMLATVGGVLFKLVMKSLVMPLLGGPAVNPAFRSLTGNPSALALILFEVIVGAAFGEEVLFRGFLFERLRRLFGWGPAARAGIVLLTSALFAAAHYSLQGLAGVEQAFITGAVIGSLFAATGSLLEPMIVHAAFDLTAVVLIYFGLEAGVAHWFFRSTH
jgi:membrane protease YdiL (CAAX protease family)